MDLTKFQGNVEVVKLVGTVLQLLAKGDVLKIHLKTIESSLEEHRHVETIAASISKSNGDEDEPNEVQELNEVHEPDKDLEAVQPESTQETPLYVSYSE